jgi:pyruvate formate lyase activating enzyme
MSGGVSISGGEPLMQRRPLMKVLTGAKAMGIHTAIETNGFLGAELTDSDLDNIDLVLLGIKTWDRKRHRALTGRDNTPTLELARRLAARRLPVWARFVLVPGLTDNPADIAQIADFAGSSATWRASTCFPSSRWAAPGAYHALSAFRAASAYRRYGE